MSKTKAERALANATDSGMKRVFKLARRIDKLELFIARLHRECEILLGLRQADGRKRRPR